jgi:DNA (cytosine-5)-methyltransferase 1
MLPAQLGTGGNNTPFVVEESTIPIHDQATRFSGKRGDKSDGKGNGLVVGNPGDPMNTLTSGDRHAVAYWDGGQIAGTLTANNANGAQRMPDKENFNCVIAIDRAFFNQGQNALYDPQLYEDGTNPTLVARGPNAVAVRYIVRRLTPTECARLQGFPDKWGHPDIKAELKDEEYGFWLDVRNTHAEINGKAVKDYTKKQMLTWYNKLHTDSAEYKMWGNGIALPPALYCMQGIVDVLKREH